MLSTIYAGLVFPRKDGTVPGIVTLEQFLSLLSIVNSQNTTITALRDVSLVWVFDGGGDALSTGIKAPLPIPFNCEITAVKLYGGDGVNGSAVVDLWKDTYANFPPDVSDSITASAKPTISSAQKSQDSTLTGWTKTITAGDIIVPHIDSISTFTLLTLELRVTRALT